MAIKVIAQRREVKLGKNPGMKFVMRPDLYIPIQEKKVFAEASTHSGISAGVIKAAWDAAGEVLRTWATEGHSIPLPGLGTMRFGVRSKAVEKLEDVKTGLITVRRIIFTPNVDLKDELKNTSIQITCLDEEGNVLKRVTSGDSGEVEDNENAGNENSENSENTENGGSQNGGSQNSGEQGSQQGEQNQQSGYALQIVTSGSGSATVTHDGNIVTSGATLNEDDEVEISITPAEGQVPTASINSSAIELTEDNGVYTGSFAMPGQASALVISTGVSGDGGDGGEGLDKD
jgi:predicted histone-like DNA-binding protein